MFSLSPAVSMLEKDLTLSIPNLPSSKTGMILRADTGPCNKIIAVTSESELVTWFGKPTAANYKDWFNAWNFLQYASNLYVVRPTYVDEATNASVKNAGVKLTGTSWDTDGASQENMFNADVAELTLQNDGIFASERLYFFNRNVTSDQKLGVAVCSTSTSWKSPVANEFSATLALASPSGNLKNLGNIGGSLAELEIDSNNSATIRLSSTALNTLTIGSKFEGNGKAFTVKNIYSNDNQIAVESLVDLVPGDLSLYYGTIATGGGIASGTLPTNLPIPTLTLTFDTTKRFNIQVNNVFEFIADNGTDAALYYVSTVGSVVNDEVDVVFTKSSNSNVAAAYTFEDGAELATNSTLNHFTVSAEYTGGIVPLGTTSIKVDAGFNFPVDSIMKFTLSGGSYTDLEDDEFPNETGTSDNNYIVIGVDTLNNIIVIDRALEYPIAGAPGGVPTNFTDIVTTATVLKGFNLHTTRFDSSMITSTKKYLIDVTTLKSTEFVIESLIKFSDTLEYEPNWINDEFVTVVFQKNSSGLFALVETLLASYNPSARDAQNRNMYATEVFYYSSNYLYCKVNDDETKNKVTTSAGSIVKFISDFGTPVGTPVAGDYVAISEYGTVYPLKESTSIPNTYLIDINGNFVYDATNYSKGDIQKAVVPFSDAELFDVNLLVAHELDINGMSEVAETRKDCVAIVAPYSYTDLVGKSATVATTSLLEKYGTQTVSTRKEFTRNGSYSCIYGNMKYQYDKFNDVNRWVSIGGDIAGIMANTDSTRDPWWAPAGLERGKIKNAIKLACNPNKQNRDELYVNAINPVISITGEGAAIVYGQKTATARPSALDRINVRRLLIVIEKAIATAVKYALFEFNDTFTRNRLVGIIDPFLRTVKARRGVYDYAVQCDTSNNPSSIVDANALVIDIYVKPTKVAEFIQVNMNITRSDANFQELIGGGA